MEDLQGNELGNVKPWHNPHGDCLNNGDIYKDCTCKRVRNKRPFKEVVVHDEGVAHNVKPVIVMEIYQHNGVISFREQRRKKRYVTTAAEVYAWLVRGEALAAMAARKATRKTTRKRR